MTTATRTRYVETNEHLSPTNIDNTGATNVSKAITDWIASPAFNDGDLFRLRLGLYSVPQGIKIGRPCRLDLNGSLIGTGTVMGDQDPDPAASAAIYPALWNDWGEQDAGTSWYGKRACIVVAANNVTIYSSVASAGVGGAARIVNYRGDPANNLSTGTEYDSDLEAQHGIRIEGVSNVTVDLTNIGVSYVHGDGIYMRDNATNIRILGRNLGEATVGGNVSGIDSGVLDGNAGLGGTINTTPTPDIWMPSGTVYPGIHHVSRHGIGTGFTISDVFIDGLAIWRTRWSFIDLEPAGVGDQCDNITIQNTESGIHRLRWVSAAARPCNNVTIRNNVCYEPIGVDTVTASGTRHSNWTIDGNTGGCTISNDSFTVTRIDGLTITNNDQTQTGGVGIDTGDSTSVTINPAESVQFHT